MLELDVRRCIALNKSGEPCRAQPQAERDYCPSHDPELAERRAEWLKRGGHNRANVVRAEKRVPASLQETLGVLLQTLSDVRDGSLSPSRASAVASVCRAICTTYELGMFELRMAEMERKLAERDDAV